MKTIYTDRYKLMLWGPCFLTLWFGYRAFVAESAWAAPAFAAAAIWSSAAAIREFRRRRSADSLGQDPSIYKVVEDALNK